ncbi:MAG: carbohydrate ABC transporter permease [Candidatus Humimicrobiaceae bacterium]
MRATIQKMKKNKHAYLWMSLAICLVLFSTIYPLIFAIDFSLWDTQIFAKLKFIGLQNYIDLFREGRFWQNVYNSFFFTFVGIAITFVLGLILALLLRKQTKINSTYRTLILIPWVTNEVVFALMWIWLLNPQLSPIYYWFERLGATLPDFFGNNNTALWSVTVINAWRSLGFSLVMMLAALAGIPKELEDAAEVDGCSRIGKIRFIFIPLIKPVSLVMIIVLTISFFNIIALVLVMTGGGPGYSTELLSLRLYKEGFKFFNIGTASVLTTVMLISNLILAWMYKKLISADNYY